MNVSVCTLVCARGLDIRNWSAAVGFGGSHTQVPVFVESEGQGPVIEASLDSKHLRPVTGGIYIVRVYVFSTNRLSSWSAREGDGIKPFMSSVFAWVFLAVCPAVWTAMCTCMYILCLCVCACAHWQYMLSLTNGWTWEQRAATASILLGYQIWKLLTWTQMVKQPS